MYGKIKSIVNPFASEAVYTRNFFSDWVTSDRYGVKTRILFFES